MIERFDKCPNCFKPHSGEAVCGHCGFNIEGYKMPENALPPFTILEGKYMLGRTLGMGGFGITYLGWDMNLETLIAIKEYYPGAYVFRDTTKETTTNISVTGSNQDMYDKGLKRYVDEAKNLSKFYNLPGIVSVKDFFYANETAYMVMEYVDGITLKAHLNNLGGKMSEAEVLSHMKPIIESLQQVHEKGMVHRDISPDNIMVGKDGKIKLIDFGSVRGQSLEGDQTYTVILKHGYAPQEQYYGKGKQGPWTDVYSLCATMYKMLTGNIPPNSIERMSEDTYVSPSACGISISPNTERVLNKGLAPRIEDRYQNLGQLKDALYNGATTDDVSEQATVLLNANAVGQADYNVQSQTGFTGVQQTQPMSSQAGYIGHPQSGNTVLVNQPMQGQVTPQAPAWGTANTAQNQMSFHNANPAQANNQRYNEPKRTSFVPLILVIVGILVVGVIAVVAINSSKKDDDKSTRDVVESTQGRDDDEQDVTEAPTTEAPTTEASTEEEPAIEYNAELGSNWEEFKVSIGGDIYQFPMTYTEWINYGWESNGEKFTLGSGEIREITCMDDNADYGLLIANFSSEAKTADECHVIGIRYADFWHYSYESEYYIELPAGPRFDMNGSTPSSSMAEIEAIYGEPDVIDDFDYKKIYLGSGNGFIEFGYDDEDGSCKSVLYCCLEAPDGAEVFPSTEYVDTLPQLSSYEAPEATVDRFDSVVSLLGTNYKVPIPVSVLIANGWSFVDEVDTLRPCEQMYTTMSNGDTIMYVYINNYSIHNVGLENLYVDYIYAPIGTEIDEMIMPGNVTIGDSLYDVQDLFWDISENYKAYTEYDGYVLFEVFYPTDECCVRAEFYAEPDSSGEYFITDCSFWRDMTATSMLLENDEYIYNYLIDK